MIYVQNMCHSNTVLNITITCLLLAYWSQNIKCTFYQHDSVIIKCYNFSFSYINANNIATVIKMLVDSLTLVCTTSLGSIICRVVLSSVYIQRLLTEQYHCISVKAGIIVIVIFYRESTQ